jgi:hypothetical protein
MNKKQKLSAAIVAMKVVYVIVEEGLKILKNIQIEK